MKNHMPLYKIEIPVSDYYGEEVFFQEFFFECEKCPTKEQVVGFLKELEKEELSDPGYLGTSVAKECLESIAGITSIDEWPDLHSYLVLTNVRTMTPKFGDQPLTMALITPHHLEG